MDRSQQTNSTREALRKIRQDTRQTRSLDTLRQQFEQLQNLRRQSMDDFDLQVMIGDIHQEIVDRARYLRGDAPAPSPSAPKDDHSVIFQAPVSAPKEIGPLSAPPPAAPIAMPPVASAPSPPPAPAPMTVTPPRPVVDRTDAAEIPPEVTRIDPKSWQTIVGLAVFLCVIALAVAFYLIQTARKLNFPDENRAKTEQAGKPKDTSSPLAVSISPTLRLYTDLTAGVVTVDGQATRALVDGELMLDNLPAGQHSFKLTAPGGSASFQFDVVGKNAPKVLGAPQASNALVVLVSQQDGHGQLVTSAGPSDVLVDGAMVGQATAGGLELVGLGSADHDLKVVHERDSQLFRMTYTPAPVLTVYVKSDPNTGIIQVVTAGEDGVEVYIDDVLFRRRSDHGQVRISIRAGRYPIRVHKDGFTDPPMQWVEVKKAEVTQAQFEFSAAGGVASLQIRGAAPGTTTYVDQNFVAAIGPDGAAKISNIKPGEHIIELRHEQAITKRMQKTFKPGEVLTLAGADVALEKTSLDAGKPAATVASPAVTDDKTKPGTAPVGGENQAEGVHVQKGGGFIPYDTPKAAGHYSFRTQGHVGGLLKKGKLQWYAAFQDNNNYVLFVLDGKHAEVREVRHGKSILWNRVACPVDSASWVQVDLTVKPGAVSSRIKTAGEGWTDLGSVASIGRDFTQDKVGFYIPPNDEVAVSNFKFASR